jgi:hypothetical protein
VECFGSEGLTPREFEDLLESFNTVQPDASFQRIPLGLGLAMANAAAALTLRRHHVLPREYFFWRELVALHPYDARQYQLPMHDAVFGQLDPWQALVMQRTEADAAFLPW